MTNSYCGADGMSSLYFHCRTLAATGDRSSLQELRNLLLTYDGRTFEKDIIPRIASASILINGPAGAFELKELVYRAPGSIYPAAIMETLWRAATKQPIPSNALVRLEQFVVDDATSHAARVVVDDLIIESEVDDDLRLMLLFYAASEEMTSWGNTDNAIDEIVNFGRYMFSVFRSASIRVTEAIIRQLEEMIDNELPEARYQEFLRLNPVLLDPLAAEVISQARLGSDLITDYVIRCHDSRYLVVEIEKPQDAMMTSQNNFSAKFTHAMGQILDFQNWISENNSYAQSKLPGIDCPSGIIVIGRRDKMSAQQEKKLRRWCRNSKSVEVLTFDDLVRRGRLLLTSLRLESP